MDGSEMRGGAMMTGREQLIAKLKERVYLGDGVYAQHDGYQIWIDTGGETRIALEDEVLVALDLYRKTVADLIAAINAAAE